MEYRQKKKKKWSTINLTAFESKLDNNGENNMAEIIWHLETAKIHFQFLKTLSLGDLSLSVESLNVHKWPLIAAVVDYMKWAQLFPYPHLDARHVTEAPSGPPDQNITTEQLIVDSTNVRCKRESIYLKLVWFLDQ